MIDRAIIRLQAGAATAARLPGTYLQQFPYPCYQEDAYALVVFNTLPLQVVLACIFTVALQLRNVVHEREAGLERMMRVHGLRGGVAWLAWFLTAWLSMSTLSALVIGVLKFGGILEHSNSGVLFALFQCFSISTIMMVYMVAAFFSRTTVAALSGVIIYIVSYLPFVIMLAREAKMAFAVKMFFFLSSTTAFSFATTYVDRFEQQGIGIQVRSVDYRMGVLGGGGWAEQRPAPSGPHRGGEQTSTFTVPAPPPQPR